MGQRQSEFETLFTHSDNNGVYYCIAMCLQIYKVISF